MPIDGTYVPIGREWVREQIDAYESSGGREQNTFRDSGIPVIILTTRGARSGAVRKAALLRVHHEGEYGLVASLGGGPKSPAWYFNLLHDPEIPIIVARATNP